MKQFLTICGLLLTQFLSAQTIYVKANAVGTNNGSSWLNAFVSLDAALAVATPGQSIWVSAGTYKPATTFLLQTGVSLYGGFAGTETALNQRNPVTNVTILNGDLLGNDIPGNFDQNRTDNVQHVVTVFVNASAQHAVLDGFVVRGGQTLFNAPNADLTRRGAGVLAGGPVTIRNCRFTDNHAESGAAIAAIGTASDGIKIDNCLFEANKATEQAIVILRQTPTGEVNNCVFKNNVTNRGTLYPQETTNITIDSCLFEGNNAGANFGAAMFSWQASWTMTNSIFRKNKAANGGIYIDDRNGGHFVTLNNCLFEQDTTTGFGGSGVYGWQASCLVKNCIFRENYAPNAAAMYFNGREFDSQFSIDSCLFERNVSTSYGGTSIWHNRTNYTLSNSIFRDNVAPNSAGGVYNGDTTIFHVTNCLFEGHQTNFAAAVANYGVGCKGVFEDCTFQDNEANTSGGAVSNGFKADVAYKNCLFLRNSATFGGAIFTQNDTTRLEIDGCLFQENGTDDYGGAVFVNDNIATTIKNSSFLYNTSDYGAAIQAYGDSLLSIENTIFLSNFAVTQGGAINMNQTKANLTNCLFAKNINLSAGAGGAISVNASDSVSSRVTAVNCTFADNEAQIGAGIAQWESDAGDVELSLLNCLFQNPFGNNYEIEDGTPLVISLNGNQSSDASFVDDLTGNKDVHDLSAAFMDPPNDDYRLLMGPAVDGGVAAGAPTTDLLGNLRQGLPDRGCYELGINSVKNVGFHMLDLQCNPSPATEMAVLSLENERAGDMDIQIWNAAGQLVFQVQAVKAQGAFQFPLQVASWPAGMYRVQCRMGAIMHEGSLIKQ
ncbi:MAG: hypothetical protein JNN28_16340 [Saprospiraceae bacterium]|nr:hypothetical protein [Saprospiraceae bacterium]